MEKKKIQLNLSDREASHITDSLFVGLGSCDWGLDCDICKMRANILQQLVDQGFRTGHDYRALIRARGPSHHEYQKWLQSQKSLEKEEV